MPLILPNQQQPKMSENLPMVISTCRELMVIENHADFMDQYDDAMMRTAQKELIQVQDELDATHRKIGVTVHQMACRHPLLASMMRTKLNELRRLKGTPEAQPDQDPMTGHSTESKDLTDEDLVAELKAREQEEEARKEAWKRLGPSTQKRLKRAMRHISSYCHPDVTKDTNLHDVFKIAKRIFDSGDIDTLDDVVRDVDHYRRVRKDKYKFRDFKRQTTNNFKAQRAAVLSQVQQIHTSLEWRCVKALENGEPTETHYHMLVMAHMENLDRQIKQIREQQYRTTAVYATPDGFKVFRGSGTE